MADKHSKLKLDEGIADGLSRERLVGCCGLDVSIKIMRF